MGYIDVVSRYAHLLFIDPSLIMVIHQTGRGCRDGTGSVFCYNIPLSNVLSSPPLSLMLSTSL